MTYLNPEKMAISAQLIKAYYRLPRREQLDKQFGNLVTDYFSKIATGRPFEARGLIVTGESRSGKTREIKAVVDQFNAERNPLPDGSSARFVQCTLSGMLSWKDLGIQVLDSLGYPLRAQRTQSYIWHEVIKQARLQGVIGIHFDECQHMFSSTAKNTNAKVLDGFKALCKDKRWPFAVILSGVPALASFVAPYVQLKELLNPIHFELIGGQNDIMELHNLCYAYAETVEIDFAPLATQDFYDRLAFACGRRRGLVIELVIDALTLCKMDGKAVINSRHFESAYAQKTGISMGYSPFSVDDYLSAFSEAKLLALSAREDA